MDIWDENKLAMFIAFVIPGFIALKTYEALSLRNNGDSSQQIINAIACSCINYALLLGPIMLVEDSNIESEHHALYVMFWVGVILVSPLLLAILFWRSRELRFVQRFLPHPVGKPWDYVFRQRGRFWAIVTLNSGRQIGGRFDSRSFASSSPNAQQIYIEQTWIVNDDGGFERPREASAGILVVSSEISTVELFTIEEAS